MALMLNAIFPENAAMPSFQLVNYIITRNSCVKLTFQTVSKPRGQHGDLAVRTHNPASAMR
jgi:hypothetical protein